MAGGEVERNGGGDERSLVIDGERRQGGPEMRESGQRNHRLLAGRDRSAGGGGGMAGRGDRIDLEVARRIGGDRRGGAGSGGRRGKSARGRIGALRAGRIGA